MWIGKKVALPLSSLLLLFSVTANAETCVKVDDDNSPAAIVSGRITTHHKLPKWSEGRTGDGPWLILDQPLLADHTGGGITGEPSYEFCYKWRKIAILPGGDGEKAEAQITQLKKGNNQHVRIDGKWGRLGSARVSQSIFIKITTKKKDCPKSGLQLDPPLRVRLPPQQSNLGRHRAWGIACSCPYAS